MKFLVLGCNGMAGHTISLYLKEQGQKAGQFVKGQAGATSKVLSNVKNLCS